MDIQPIHGIPALRVGNNLVIGDLHIGVEAHLGIKGFHIVSHTDDMMDSILEAAGTECGNILVIGDVKDSVPGSTKQEYREIPVFFDRLIEQFDSVEVVRGNHDTLIEEFLPGRVRIRPASGVRINNVGFIHGHTWPSADVMDCKTLVMAHNHPTVMFKDGVGKQTSEPCWVRGKFIQGSSTTFDIIPEEFIVIPAFNRMLGGSPVNIVSEKLLGPVLNSELVDMDNSELYLLDGVCLGKRSDLMLKGREWNRRNIKKPKL